MSLNHEEQDFYDYSLDDELYIFDKKESSRGNLASNF